MPRTMSVTEARDNFPALVRRVADGGEPVVITRRNEPKVILFDYAAYQRQQALWEKNRQVILDQHLTLAERMVESTLEGYRPDSMDVALFPETFEHVIHDVWQICRGIDKPHRMLAITLLDAIINLREGGERLTREHLETLSDVLPLLRREYLTVDEVVEADRRLLAAGLNAVWSIEDESFVSLYERDWDEEG